MPTLLSSGPQGTTGVTLENNAFWRLQLGATGDVALALIIRYPPAQAANIVALAKCPVGIATTPEEVQRVAEVILTTGTKEGDMARLEEAYNLFKNNNRAPSASALEAAVADGKELLEVYYELQEWIMQGSVNRFSSTYNLYEIVGIP